MNRTRPTQKQIADKLGLSAATVSLALRNNPVVAKATRALVQEAMRESGYVPNLAAASLRTGRSNIVGVSVHDLRDPFVAEIVISIERVLAESGIVVLINNHGESVEQLQRFVSTLATYGADGLLVIPPPDTAPSLFDPIRARGTPVLYIGRCIEDDRDADCVVFDARAAANLATRHLLEAGHRRLALVGGLAGTSTSRDQVAGFRDAIEQAGIEWDDAAWTRSTLSVSGGMSAAERLMASSDAPTAFVCANDLVATGVMRTVRAADAAKCDCVAVVSATGSETTALYTNGLKQMRVDPGEIGLRAAETMLGRIAGPDGKPKRVMLDFEPVLSKQSGTDSAAA